MPLTTASRRCLTLAVLLAGRASGASEPVVLTIQEGVRLALAQHEDLRMAHAAVSQSQQGVREERADILPQLTASGSYTRNWLLPTAVFNNQTLKIGSDNGAAGTLRLTQPLYTGGRSSGRIGSAREQVAAAREALRAAEQETRARVEAAFYEYLLARELAGVSDLRLRLARSAQGDAEALRRAGRVPEYDVIRARVQVATSQADSIGAANQLELSEVRLKDAMGLQLDARIRVDAAFREASELSARELPVLVEQSLASRPEYRQLLAQLAAARRRIAVERAGSRPTVDLVASGQMQFQNDQLDKVSAGEEWRRSWATGLALQVPLFDGRRTDARVAQASLEIRRLEARRAQLERAIELEVRSAWLDLAETRERLGARRAAVAEATSGLGIAAARYRGGSGTQLEVLDAHLSVVQAESGYAQARRDRAVALVQLERAVGVLGESAQ